MQTWLYHIDCLKGRLFRTGDEVEKALAEGWVDAPGKCVEDPQEEPIEPQHDTQTAHRPTRGRKKRHA